LSNSLSAPMSAAAIFSNKQAAHKASVTRGTCWANKSRYERTTNFMEQKMADSQDIHCPLNEYHSSLPCTQKPCTGHYSDPPGTVHKQPVTFQTILILSRHLSPGPPRDVFTFLPIFSYFLISPIHATCQGTIKLFLRT
jgi:hypothetical protein